MHWKIAWLATLLLALAAVASAQSGYTTVTATVADSAGSIYANAPFNVSFYDPGTSGKLPLLNGSTFQQAFTGVNTSSSGTLSIAIPDNGIICSSSGECGTQWIWSFTSQQIAGNKYTFSCQLTITGASEDISAALTACATTLPTPSVSGCSPTGNVGDYQLKVNSTTCGAAPTNYGPFGIVNSKPMLFYATPWYDVVGASGSITATTGSIGASSHTLILASAIDFVNGQGVAIFGAGATSSLSAPTSPSVSQVAAVIPILNIATSGMGSVHGITCSGGVATIETFGWHGFLTGQSITLAGDSVSGYDGTYTIASTPANYTITVSTTCHGNSDGGTITLQPGSTTFKYQVIAMDSLSGFSATTSSFQVASANALSQTVHNHLSWTASTGAVEYLVYGDGGLGGSFTCVGPAIATTQPGVNPSYDDYIGPGEESCPANAPTNPPGSATKQLLITSISSGAGTTSLTLAAAATTAVSGVTIQHDDTAAINAAIALAAADSRANPYGGGAVANLQQGKYNVQQLIFPNSSPVASQPVTFQYSGVLFPRVPLDIGPTSGPYMLRGISGGAVIAGSAYPTAEIQPLGVAPAIHIHQTGHNIIQQLSIDLCPNDCVRIETDSGGGSVSNTLLNSSMSTQEMSGGSAVGFYGTAFGLDIEGGVYASTAGGTAITNSTVPSINLSDVGIVKIAGTLIEGSGIELSCPNASSCGDLTLDGTASPSTFSEGLNTPTLILNPNGHQISKVIVNAVSNADNYAGTDASIVSVISSVAHVFTVSIVNAVPQGNGGPSNYLGIISPSSIMLNALGFTVSQGVANTGGQGVGAGTLMATLYPYSQYVDQLGTLYLGQNAASIPAERILVNSSSGNVFTVENAAGTSVLAGIDFAGNATFNNLHPVTDHSATVKPTGHSVMDSVTLSGGASTITFTGSAVWTATADYICSFYDVTTPANAVTPTYTSASVLTLAGTGTDIIKYNCQGY